MTTGVCLKNPMMLDQCTGLVSIQTWHHDVQQDQVRLVIGNHAERFKAIGRRDHFKTFFFQQGLGSSCE